jgi:histone-lysine N-methyltransferase SETMAR
MDNEALLAAVEADNGQTWEEVAQQFKVSAETIRLDLHHLGKTQKLSRSVPHELTVAQQVALADACLSLLSRQRNDPFLDRLLTCDEKWVLYDTPRRRHHWFAPHEPVPKQPKPPLYPKKIMLCVWWTARGIVHRELLPAGQTVNATVYSGQLERVHKELKTKEPALVARKGVVLLDDNAKPDVAKVTRETIIRLGRETPVHPPHSPDIAPSDCRLFHSLDKHLRGRQFRSPDVVRTALDGLFASCSKEFYQNGVQGLSSRSQRDFDGDGEYFLCYRYHFHRCMTFGSVESNSDRKFFFTYYMLKSRSQKIRQKHSIKRVNRSLKVWQSSNTSEQH